MEILKGILHNEPKDLKVLDVGTGIGSFIEILQESLTAYKVIIGIDPNKTAIDKAKELFKNDRTQFICMGGENMTFEDNSFDVVCISNTLHHLPNKEKVLKEMKRVLKVNGLFIVNEMFFDNQSEKQLSHVKLHHLQGEIDTLLGKCHNKTFSKEELICTVKDLNLKMVDMFEFNTHEEQLKTENLEKEEKILEESFNAIAEKLKNIKDFEEYNLHLNTLEKLKTSLYDIGFFTATELMIICRKI